MFRLITTSCAALVDGYTRFRAFRKIVLPLAAPAITAVSFIALAQAWNEFIFVVLLGQRFIMRGLTFGALKG